MVIYKKAYKRKIALMVTVMVILVQIIGAQGSNALISNSDEWWFAESEEEYFPTLNYNDLTEQEKVIWNYYDTVNNRDENNPDGDWKTRVELTAPSERDVRYAFSNNEKNRRLFLGIFNLKSARMVYIKQTETAPADQYNHPDAILETYLVGLDCTVFKEDLFTFNGINFDEVLLEYVDGVWYILENRSVSTEALEAIGNESLTEDAIAHCEYNRMTESTHNPLIERPELLEIIPENEQALWLADAMARTQKGETSTTRASSLPMHPCASNHQPSDIYILLTDGTIYPDYFTPYVKKTLQNECAYSYSSINQLVPGITESQYYEGMKATAMAVKMFAWWCRSIMAKHKNESAHVCSKSSCCQVYSKNSIPQPWVAKAVNDTCDYGIRTDKGWIMIGQYRAGEWNSAGTAHTGKLLQKGAFYLAKQGYNFQDILSYYYANVPTSIPAPYPAYPNTISRGPLQFFTAIH